MASVKCRSAGPIKFRSAGLFDYGSCGHIWMVMYGARGMHYTNSTMVTKENCIMGEAEKALDCHMMKRFFFQEQLLQRILMPMENIDGYLRNTMQ